MSLSDVRIWTGTEFVSIAGPKGETGATGSAASITVGTVTEGPVSVTNSGTANSAVLDFSIPKGDPGLAATLTVGAVTTGASGSQATVTNAGTQNAAVLNFTIPQGPKGDPGKDGTGVSIQGTATAWPPAATPAVGDMWILGDPVPPGAPVGSQTGDGVVWTGTEWNNVGSIQGPPGAPGAPGTAATVAVGSVTTVQPGVAASIVNVGTQNAAVLNFTIPQGVKGDKGEPGENNEVYRQTNQPVPQRLGALWLVPSTR